MIICTYIGMHCLVFAEKAVQSFSFSKAVEAIKIPKCNNGGMQAVDIVKDSPTKQNAKDPNSLSVGWWWEVAANIRSNYTT